MIKGLNLPLLTHALVIETLAKQAPLYLQEQLVQKLNSFSAETHSVMLIVHEIFLQEQGQLLNSFLPNGLLAKDQIKVVVWLQPLLNLLSSLLLVLAELDHALLMLQSFLLIKSVKALVLGNTALQLTNLGLEQALRGDLGFVDLDQRLNFRVRKLHEGLNVCKKTVELLVHLVLSSVIQMHEYLFLILDYLVIELLDYLDSYWSLLVADLV